MAHTNGTNPAGVNADKAVTNLEDGEVVETVTQETARKAQRVVAAHSNDTTECIMLLDMLGVGPHSAS